MQTKTCNEEWVGGRFELPIQVGDLGDLNPHALVWMDPKYDLVLGVDLVPPDAPTGVLATFLTHVIQNPTIGKPRIPARVRLSSIEEARYLKKTYPKISVLTAETPELEAIKSKLGEFVSGSTDSDTNVSYLTKGVRLATVSSFFSAAADLYNQSFWDVLEPEEALRVDIPAYGIRNACLITIGQLGDNFGVLLFDSPQDYRKFYNYSGEFLNKPNTAKRKPLPSRIFSINFDNADHLPDALREEVYEYDWPLASDEAYPSVIIMKNGGDHIPPTEKDYDLATVLCTALAQFFDKHGDTIMDHIDRGNPPRIRMQTVLRELPNCPTVTLSGIDLPE